LALSEQDTKLTQSIDTLDKKIAEIMIKTFKVNQKKIKTSLITSKRLPPQLTLSLENSTIFNNNDERITIKNLKKGDDVSVYAELDCIQKTEDEITLLWRVIQMKQIIHYDLSVSLFKKDIKNEPVIKNIPPPPPPAPPAPILSLSSTTTKIAKQFAQSGRNSI